MKIVIALGGNALGETPEKQKEITKYTAKCIAPIIRAGHQVILTHGNGPQVGLINLAFEEGMKINKKVYSMPFSECNAMSEGYIGYHLQNALENELNTNKVISLITQVEVNKDDEAFKNPTKPIGSFYTEETASKMPYVMKEDAGRGYRRVIASPKPVKVVEEQIIKALIDENYLVIACGGGGVPVIKEDGKYVGVDAVIDKDYASSKLASDINADCLMILTAVENVKVNFNKDNERNINHTTLHEMVKYNENNEFLKGSMKPKVEACIDFLNNNNNGIAIITSIDKAIDALNEKCGTIIKVK